MTFSGSHDPLESVIGQVTDGRSDTSEEWKLADPDPWRVNEPLLVWLRCDCCGRTLHAAGATTLAAAALKALGAGAVMQQSVPLTLEFVEAHDLTEGMNFFCRKCYEVEFCL